MTDVFLDATTLISLGTVGELDHLTAFAGALVVPPRVQDEVTTEPARTNLDRFIEREQIRTEVAGSADEVPRAREVLGEESETGDVQLIAAVLTYTGGDRTIGIVSDDRRVRTTARGLGATVTGTVGVVVRAVEGSLSPGDAHELVRRIDAHGLHMTGQLREKANSLIDDAVDE
jgi:predicted nucleic acid-binding protein